MAELGSQVPDNRLSFYRAVDEGRTEPLDFGDLRWREVN